MQESISPSYVRELCDCMCVYLLVFNLIWFQVCKAFEGHLDPELLLSTKDKEQAIAEQHERQRAWCKRKADGKLKWRPKKRHRVAAFHWAQNFDNQTFLGPGRLEGF